MKDEQKDVKNFPHYTQNEQKYELWHVKKSQATKHVQHSSDDILESYIIDSVLDKFCYVNTAASEIFLSNVLWDSNCPKSMTATHMYRNSQWYYHHFLLIGSICGVEESHHK